jgi:hypothetical protein
VSDVCFDEWGQRQNLADASSSWPHAGLQNTRRSVVRQTPRKILSIRILVPGRTGLKDSFATTLEKNLKRSMTTADRALPRDKEKKERGIGVQKLLRPQRMSVGEK